MRRPVFLWQREACRPRAAPTKSFVGHDAHIALSASHAFSYGKNGFPRRCAPRNDILRYPACRRIAAASPLAHLPLVYIDHVVHIPLVFFLHGASLLFFHLLVSICICGEMIPCGDVFCRKNDPRQEKPSEDAPPRGIFCLSPQDLTCLHTGAFAFFHGYGAVHQHIVHTLRQTAGVFVGGGLVQLF